MTPFLKQTAQHYIDRGGIDKLCFVFPNRRSSVFFKEYLSASVKAAGDMKPFMMPAMTSMGDFFSAMYGAPVADKVALLLELYSCYKELNPKAESLDDFIFWGDVILSDFSDVDKYLVNPDHIFTNVSDYRSIQESFEFLEKEQMEAVKAFAGHFRERPDAAKEGVKEKFMQIWNILLPLYNSFNGRLRSLGMAYDGMACRHVADRLKAESASDIAAAAFPGTQLYVFVGLNALNECERRFLGKLRDGGMAEFCWDYGKGMISDPANRASLFMERNVHEFPQAFIPDPDGLPDPVINVVSVPSAAGGVKQVPGILADTGPASEVGTLGSGNDCAIVLPDESLSESLLNSIPPEFDAINVTMGSPMSGSAWFGFISELLSAQIHIRMRGGAALFYHRQLWNLFSSPVFNAVASADDLAIAGEIRAGAKYYVPEDDYKSSPLLALLLRPVVADPKAADSSVIRALGGWLIEVSENVAPALLGGPFAIEAEFAKRCYGCINRLRDRKLPITPASYIRLLGQLLALEAVPFEGEPVQGLQIMGPLETRALDFDNVIVLSCNEGVFPGRSMSPSFIPPEVRRGFSLPSSEYQDAVWAYYFYRMIRRARNVWLIYDSRTESLRGGEESRFIKQLRYHFRLPLCQWVAMGPAGMPEPDDCIPKPEDIAQRLKEMTLSATSFENWLKCPAMFYYGKIAGLKPENEVNESLDAKMIGIVFHAVMQALYLGPEAMSPDFNMDSAAISAALRSGRFVPLKDISRGYIEEMLKNKGVIRAKIRSLVKEQLRTVEVTGRNLVIEDVIAGYVDKCLENDLRLLKEKERPSFRILGLELKRAATIAGYKFTGTIDRLDAFGDGMVRIVDYKTGRVGENDINLGDEKADAVVEKLFGTSNGNRPLIAFQLYVYNKLMENDPLVQGMTVVNSIYQPGRLYSEGDMTSIPGEKFISAVDGKLSASLALIADPSVPFRRIEEDKTCKYCDFKGICGRKGTDYYK